jgi:hypothetical protein
MNRFLILGQIHKGLLSSYYSERYNNLTFTKIVIADEVNQSLEIASLRSSQCPFWAVHYS